MVSLRMRGPYGELRKGYKVAVKLSQWEMDETGRVSASPSEPNDYWLDQPGQFALWLWMGGRAWVWSETEILDRGTPFAVLTTGTPVVRDVARE